MESKTTLSNGNQSNHNNYTVWKCKTILSNALQNSNAKTIIQKYLVYNASTKSLPACLAAQLAASPRTTWTLMLLLAEQPKYIARQTVS